jgi:hypothetical protein
VIINLKDCTWHFISVRTTIIVLVKIIYDKHHLLVTEEIYKNMSSLQQPQTPVLLLKEGTTETKKEDAQKKQYNSCKTNSSNSQV